VAAESFSGTCDILFRIVYGMFQDIKKAMDATDLGFTPFFWVAGQFHRAQHVSSFAPSIAQLQRWSQRWLVRPRRKPAKQDAVDRRLSMKVL
jgi:hypothetical protein